MLRGQAEILNFDDYLFESFCYEQGAMHRDKHVYFGRLLCTSEPCRLVFPTPQRRSYSFPQEYLVSRIKRQRKEKLCRMN